MSGDAGWCHPVQRWRMKNSTGGPFLGWRRRVNQARNSGAAFMSVGNTRPELPTNVSIPKRAAQARTWLASNDLNKASICWRRCPYREANRSAGSECVKFRPPLPASKNLRPMLGMASNTCTSTPARDNTSAAINPAGPPPTTTTFFIMPNSILQKFKSCSAAIGH